MARRLTFTPLVIVLGLLAGCAHPTSTVTPPTSAAQPASEDLPHKLFKTHADFCDEKNPTSLIVRVDDEIVGDEPTRTTRSPGAKYYTVSGFKFDSLRIYATWERTFWPDGKLWNTQVYDPMLPYLPIGVEPLSVEVSSWAYNWFLCDTAGPCDAGGPDGQGSFSYKNSLSGTVQHEVYVDPSHSPTYDRTFWHGPQGIEKFTLGDGAVVRCKVQP